MDILIQHIISGVRRCIIATVAVVFAVFVPAPYAFADGVDDTTPSASASCSPVAPAPTGITRPTGSDAGTYTYNSCTGMWENAYYTWSPATQTATPKTPYVYSCDTTTWKWVTQQWVYSPGKSAFVQVPIVVAVLPADAVIASGSPLICTPPPAPAAAQNISGPSSTRSIDSTVTNGTTINNINTASLNNQLNSIALSGDAAVLGNTLGGNATSGNAAAMATILNAINSSTNLSSNVATFVANIDGNVQGNLLIDPNQLQPASGNETLNTTNNLTINTQNNGSINNDITLNAASGDATVANNTTGGNATTGNAEAIANVVNMLNSIVTAGKSFVGVVNINGDLNGDILVPQNFLDSLIATNAPSATVNISKTTANNLDLNSTTNQNISNTVNNSASSGSATVGGNTTGGTATTGDASTSVRIFNLTGNRVVDANSLLVFVNVSGQWVGVIMNAPTGTTAAALGGNVTENTINNVDINSATNDTINNTINLAAASGDATVANNTTGGNATSGNASTAANLLNMDNTDFNTTGWFGILFINVFGNWIGSFGVQPPAVATSSGSSGSTAPVADPNATTNPPSIKVFRFVSQSEADSQADAGVEEASATSATLGATLASKVGQTLGATTHSASTSPAPHQNHQAQAVGGILVVAGVSTMAIERIISRRNERSAS